MIIITNRPEQWADAEKVGCEVVPHIHPTRTAAGLASEGEGRCFKDLVGTRGGDCLILGMGPSRRSLPADIGIPIFGINKAAQEHRVDYWMVHDHPALALAPKVPVGVPIVTFANNWLRDTWGYIRGTGREVWFYDMYADPTAHARRPLYWNATTLGLTLDLAFLMGFTRIFTLGTDLTVGGYKNDFMDEQDVITSHEAMKDKMRHMFRKDELPKWNTKGLPVIDLSGGNMPCEKWDLEKALPYLRGSK